METPERSMLTAEALATEKARYFGTAGCSAGNRSCGFRPAFMDRETGRVYLSSFADGRPASVHLLDGLPPALVLARTAAGRVTAVKGSVLSGFARDGHFYTREEALREAEAEAEAAAAAECGSPPRSTGADPRASSLGAYQYELSSRAPPVVRIG